MKTPKYWLGIALMGVVQLAAVAQPGLNPDRDPGDHSLLELGSTHSNLKRGVDHHLVGPATASVAAAASKPHLTYYGGPVIQKVRIYKVLYGSTGTYQSFVTATAAPSVASFLTYLPTSAYFAWLTEYNTTSPAQTIGFGSYGGSFSISPASSRNGSTITDSQIQAEISSQIGAGHLPASDNNTIYMMFFPKGKRISQGGSGSCVAGGFCAYHSTFRRNGQYVFYGVFPDMSAGSGCDSGCGNGSAFGNQTSVASHELIEAVTDPAVGVATVFGPPLGWYDGNNGEIGDICNAQQGSIVLNALTYTVQKEWSNQKAACIVNK